MCTSSVCCSLLLPLQIFHELEGPVFPPRHLRESFLVQEILDKIAAKRAEQDFGQGNPAQG